MLEDGDGEYGAGHEKRQNDEAESEGVSAVKRAHVLATAAEGAMFRGFSSA